MAPASIIHQSGEYKTPALPADQGEASPYPIAISAEPKCFAMIPKLARQNLTPGAPQLYIVFTGIAGETGACWAGQSEPQPRAMLEGETNARSAVSHHCYGSCSLQAPT